MSLRVKIEEIGASTLAVVPRYNAADFALDIDFNAAARADLIADRINHAVGVKERIVLLISGSLTLTFSGDELRLAHIDAYTNYHHWSQENVPLPSKVSLAQCSLQTSTDDDRISFECQPDYIFDSDAHRLLIKVSEEDAGDFYRLADNLIIGVAEEKIVFLLVENIAIR